MSKSTIEWTESTWNPVTGCNQISPGCKNCYAAVLSNRLKAMGIENYSNGFELTLQPQMLSIPKKVKKPTKFFVNSMSDLFHKEIPFGYIQSVFKVMIECPQHTFQILTKRSDRLRDVQGSLPWLYNIWQGVSVESPEYFNRIDDLINTDAKVKWLSLEPLLAPMINLPLDGIDWVVVGGESTPSKAKLREMGTNWVRDIRDQCIDKNVPFFFKQWGGINSQKKKNGRTLDGIIHDEWPQQIVNNTLLNGGE